MSGEKRDPAVVTTPESQNGDQLPGVITSNNKARTRRTQRRKAMTEPPHTVALYDGRTRLGDLIEREHGVEAVTADGDTLGIYNTESAAARALLALHRGGASCPK